MRLETTILCVLLWRTVEVLGEPPAGGNGTAAVLSRHRRYIVFPKGASLQLLLEVLVHVRSELEAFVGPTLQVAWPLPTEEEPPSGRLASRRSRESPLRRRRALLRDAAAMIQLFGTTVGLAWQLPDDPQIYSESKKKHKIYKRNAFKKMEAFLRPGGSDGRQCVLRALCESGQRTPAKKEFLLEILHKIFSYDDEDEVEDSPEDEIYRRAHRSTNRDCAALYPGCGFSVFDSVR